MSAHYARGASTQGEQHDLVLSVRPGRYASEQGSPFVRANARLEDSPHFLVLRLRRTARSARRGPSSSRKACPSAACPAGSFANKEGSIRCELCDYNTYSNSAGASNCTACEIGKMALTKGSIECVKSQYLAVQGGTVPQAMRRVTLVVRGFEV